MDLTLVLHNMPLLGVMWCGVSGRQLGKLPQNESMDLPLTLLAVTPGLQVARMCVCGHRPYQVVYADEV